MSDTIVIGKISDLVIEMLANEEPLYNTVPTKPLTDGRILIGRQHWAERSAPSRVIFVPFNSGFAPVLNKSNWVTGPSPNGLQTLQPGFQSHLLGRPLATDQAEYLVYCWGQSTVNDREKDFDATRWLAHVVIRACMRVAMTSVRVFRGEGWTDQRPDGASLLSAGHEFCFGVVLDIPIIDSAVQFPAGPLTAIPTLEIE